MLLVCRHCHASWTYCALSVTQTISKSEYSDLQAYQVKKLHDVCQDFTMATKCVCVFVSMAISYAFRGEVTIQIVNQAGDFEYVQEVIPYNDRAPDSVAGRVTIVERGLEDWGLISS